MTRFQQYPRACSPRRPQHGEKDFVGQPFLIEDTPEVDAVTWGTARLGRGGARGDSKAIRHCEGSRTEIQTTARPPSPSGVEM